MLGRSFKVCNHTVPAPAINQPSQWFPAVLSTKLVVEPSSCGKPGLYTMVLSDGTHFSKGMIHTGNAVLSGITAELPSGTFTYVEEVTKSEVIK